MPDIDSNNKILMKIHEGIGVLRGEVTSIISQMQDIKQDFGKMDDKLEQLNIMQTSMVATCKSYRDQYSNRIDVAEKHLDDYKAVRNKNSELRSDVLKWGIGILVTIALAIVGYVAAN